MQQRAWAIRPGDVITVSGMDVRVVASRVRDRRVEVLLPGSVTTTFGINDSVTVVR